MDVLEPEESIVKHGKEENCIDLSIVDICANVRKFTDLT